MKSIKLCLCIAVALLITACDGGQTAKLQKTIDSLQTLNMQNESDLEGMSYFISTLAEGLDTIAKQEGQLFYSNKGPEGTLVDREQLKKNLEAFAQTLQDQRAKVRMMTDSLKNMGENAQKMKFLIDNLQREIDKKDQIIRRLQEELQKKDANIADLRNKLEEISAINTKLTTKVREQEDKLYAGFVLMGEKKNLKEGGFISGGGLTKTKVNVSTMDKSFFTKVDIREFTELEIPSKSPKLIFSAPKKSYKLQKGKEGSLLTIIDPEEFWKNSRYLVIQL